MKATKKTEIDAIRLAIAFFIALCLFLGAPNFARALEESQTLATSFGAVKIDFSILPDTVSLYDPILLRATIEKPRALRLDKNDVEGDYGDFEVEPTSDEKKELDDRRDQVVRSWKLYPKRTGENKLPPIPLRFLPTLGESEAESTVAILPERTLVVTDKNETTKSIEEIAPNLESLRPFPTFWVLLGATILAIGVAIFYALRSRVPTKSETSETTPRETPLEKALRELDALKVSRVFLENRPEFYAQVVDVLRVYLRDEFKINAEEKTTQEILAEIDATRSVEGVLNVVCELDDASRAAIGYSTLKTPEIKRKLEDALNSVDLVKFAKRETTFNDASAVYNAVRQVVENAASEFSAKLNAVEEQIARQNAALEATTTTNAPLQTYDPPQDLQTEVEKASR